MIKHIVAFTFKPETSPADVQATLDALNALQGQIPWVRNWSLGKNLSTRDQTYEYALHCDFASEQELQDYLTHPAHERVVRELLTRHWASRAIVDYEYPG
jgi:2,3-dihydroxy-p-cumate/2,3-dihydroxybenzoate 3,4-dioxygenase